MSRSSGSRTSAQALHSAESASCRTTLLAWRWSRADAGYADLAMWRPRTYHEIQSAIGSLQESHVLDFKSQFSKAADTANDIASMTLSGGEIVYGIDEQKTHTAQAVTPVTLANARERLQQIANTSVFPPAAISVTLIELSKGAPDGVVVLEIPPSPLAPHMANDRYPARSGTTTRYLSDAEVERLHLQRHAYGESAGTRAPFTGFYGSGGRTWEGLFPAQWSGDAPCRCPAADSVASPSWSSGRWRVGGCHTARDCDARPTTPAAAQPPPVRPRRE